MLRLLSCLLLLATTVESSAQESDAPPIVIESPDQPVTFAFSTIKQHNLTYDARNHQLVAHVVFEEEERYDSTSNTDMLDFRLPGVTFDAPSATFYAMSATGERIPIARLKHEFLLAVIKTLPNAIVRVQHPRGHTHVLLVALKPGDPRLTAKPTEDEGSEGKSFNLRDILQ